MQASYTSRAKTSGGDHLVVSARARLHLSLLQMSHAFLFTNLGVGLEVEGPEWVIRVSKARQCDVTIVNPDVDMPHDFLADVKRLLAALTTIHDCLATRLEVVRGIPPHVGLGSKTALLCAVLRAKTAFSHSGAQWQRLRALTGRGGTSGIGINTVVRGGFVLDAGHRECPDTRTLAPSSSRVGCCPPAIAGRWSAPRWPILLATISDARRCFGRDEHKLFSESLPLDRREVERLAAIVLFELVPAVSTQDYGPFVTAVHKLQAVGFKRREWEWQDERVRLVRDAAYRAGAECVALSSVGPTLAIWSRRNQTIERALQALRMPALELRRTYGSNRGVSLTPA
jgi:beta-ribofuranosylaminobenzene 5'-phosphate synthase